MNWIVAKKNISENITQIEINAPEIASKQKPGQHVYIKITKNSERIPLIVSRVNKTTGIVKLFIHVKGLVHRQLANMTAGNEIYSIEGPFGDSIPIKYIGTVICAAGGVGITPLFPIIEAMKAAGNKVITIIGARAKEYLILQKELKKISDELIILTDDGSCGTKGLVTDGLLKVLNQEKIDQVITFGPARMIKYSSIITRRFNKPLISTMYSMRVDGIGMNATYRVSVCCNSKYICVNGVDFNAYYTNFDTMIEKMDNRLNDEYSGNQNYQSEIMWY